MFGILFRIHGYILLVVINILINTSLGQEPHPSTMNSNTNDTAVSKATQSKASLETTSSKAIKEGHKLRIKGKLEEAQKQFGKVLASKQSTGCEKADAHNGLGYVYLIQDKLKEAEDKFGTKNEEIRKKCKCAKADAHNGLGRVYIMQGKFSGAQKEFETAQTESGGAKCSYGKIDALSGLGIVYHIKGNYKEARTKYHAVENILEERSRSEEEVEKIRYDNRVADNDINKGLVDLSFEKFCAAKEKFDEAGKIYEEIENPYGQALYHTNLGITYKLSECANPCSDTCKVKNKDARDKANAINKAKEEWVEAWTLFKGLNPDSLRTVTLDSWIKGLEPE